MAEQAARTKEKGGWLKRWLLKGHVREAEGPHDETHQHQHAWWQVMCLTGVDYFSTLGYQPGIAFLAAGYLSPVATLILVLLTLFGALPIYSRVADESPHGEGSISMLEHLLSRWKGKLFVLALLGFVATDFIITITLSAADATEHILQNPYVPRLLEHRITVTLALITLLGAIFIKGFKEAIGVAVALVGAYLSLNLVVIGRGIYEIATHPSLFPGWKQAMLSAPQVHGNPMLAVGLALLLFPKLALGLSGFETGVAVMPLVKGDKGDDSTHPQGRIRNTRKLLIIAALIMSVLLITSSLITTLLIPAAEFAAPSAADPGGGEAYGRALAYLAHHFFGNGFGTVYDLSTISILWFAGASAMAGLLNIVPRYLPRYGMAPDWTLATRPLVLIYTAICFLVTVLFRASVDAQAGAYATGVLALMSSASIAVTLSAWRKGQRALMVAFGLIAAIFVYTTAVNSIERPEGVKIALIFIVAIVITSLISRAARTTELRATEIRLDPAAERFIEESARFGEIRVIANHPDERDSREYLLKEREQREDNHIPGGAPVLFLEVTVRDASEFAHILDIKGEEI
nr:amino acid transporter [Acidobacteriota bacterium]